MKLTETNIDRKRAAVRSRYPTASAEFDYGGIWSVWDMSREEQKRLDGLSDHGSGRGLFGLGASEAAAWTSAVRIIEAREGRRLPLT